jgi:uncharacterized coiled-coil DUF342 family protein
METEKELLNKITELKKEREELLNALQSSCTDYYTLKEKYGILGAMFDQLKEYYDQMVKSLA